MAHPETNPNFSLSSGRHDGGNTLGQTRRFPPEQTSLPQAQSNEPNNPSVGTKRRAAEPRSRVLDERKPRLETDHYPIRSQAPSGQPEMDEHPVHHTRAPNEPAPRLKPLSYSERNPSPIQFEMQGGPITQPEPTTYSGPDHYPIHVGQRQGFPPPRSELPRPKRDKSRGKKQGVKRPDPHTQTKPDHNSPTPLLMQRPQKTTIVTWCIAIFCAIFWIVIILGGLIVLVVYLIFRPHIPHFDITAGTLNAAYLDMDRLNADLSLLVNFTNSNRKVSVDFSYVILDLYYGGIPIATQYIEPFSAIRSETKLKSVEMITSQVYLPLAARQKLRSQMESNGLVIFDVKGIFRARSNLGSLLRYSYPLYSHCSIYLTGPPTGVLRGRRCKTKR